MLVTSFVLNKVFVLRWFPKLALSYAFLWPPFYFLAKQRSHNHVLSFSEITKSHCIDAVVGVV